MENSPLMRAIRKLAKDNGELVVMTHRIDARRMVDEVEQLRLAMLWTNVAWFVELKDLGDALGDN